MRLLNTKTLHLESFPRFDHQEISPYAILSHRWGPDEVSFQEMQRPTLSLRAKAGYAKAWRFCEVAASFGFEYAWIDTCCIDKTNLVELTEAINSMLRYYCEADVCYVYLVDVLGSDDPEAASSMFRKSAWFTRGWTLQELLAPSYLVFYNSNWNEISTKSSLRQVIADITNINLDALTSRAQLRRFSVAQRMSWASNRETERIEDVAYSLLGLFGVNMPLIYGEGEKAFHRLQLEILRGTDDESLFAWTEPHEDSYNFYGERGPPTLHENLELAKILKVCHLIKIMKYPFP